VTVVNIYMIRTLKGFAATADTERVTTPCECVRRYVTSVVRLIIRMQYTKYTKR